MKRTKAQIQKEIEGIKETHHRQTIDLAKSAGDQIAKLEKEFAALDYLVQVEDVVPGACFKNTDRDSVFVVFVVHDAVAGMYRLSGNERSHPCSLYSDAARPRASMAQYLSQHFPNKVPGQVQFISGKPETKAGDILDCISPALPAGTRLVRVYPDGSVKLFDENEATCNSFADLAGLNRQLDGKFSMYTRRV